MACPSLKAPSPSRESELRAWPSSFPGKGSRAKAQGVRQHEFPAAPFWSGQRQYGPHRVTLALKPQLIFFGAPTSLWDSGGPFWLRDPKPFNSLGFDPIAKVLNEELSKVVFCTIEGWF